MQGLDVEEQRLIRQLEGLCYRAAIRNTIRYNIRYKKRRRRSAPGACRIP